MLNFSHAFSVFFFFSLNSELLVSYNMTVQCVDTELLEEHLDSILTGIIETLLL